MGLPGNGVPERSCMGRRATDWLVCNCAAHDVKLRDDAPKREKLKAESGKLKWEFGLGARACYPSNRFCGPI